MKKIMLFILLSAVLSCYLTRLPYDSKGLTFKNKFVFNEQLEMDGYFFKQTNSGVLRVYFFQDGYYFGTSSEVLPSNLCDTIENDVRKIPYAWGCFVIDSDTLKLQRIAGYGRDKYGKFMVEELWANVESKGSILRFFQKKNINGKISPVNETYKFHPCTNKPTSANVLMQEKNK